MEQRKYVIRGLVEVQNIPSICEHVSLTFVDFHLSLTKKDKKEDQKIKAGLLKEHTKRYMKYRYFEMSGDDFEHIQVLHEQVKPYLFKDYTQF